MQPWRGEKRLDTSGCGLSDGQVRTIEKSIRQQLAPPYLVSLVLGEIESPEATTRDVKWSAAVGAMAKISRFLNERQEVTSDNFQHLQLNRDLRAVRDAIDRVLPDIKQRVKRNDDQVRRFNRGLPRWQEGYREYVRPIVEAAVILALPRVMMSDGGNRAGLVLDLVLGGLGVLTPDDLSAEPKRRLADARTRAQRFAEVREMARPTSANRQIGTRRG